jgi:hypothetical protein
MSKGFLRFLRGNTIALLALFIALGGTTYAATALPKNSVGTKQLKTNAVTAVKIKSGSVTGAKIAKNAVTGVKIADNAVTGDDINEATLAKVPSATAADTATSAGSAPPSGAAGGGLSGSYPNPGLAAPEAWHEIGAAGEPTFQNSWVNESPSTETTAAFYKDPFGVIHLKGLIASGTNNTIFTLPAGYRPSKAFVCLIFRTSGTGELVIFANGVVSVATGTGSGDLDSVTFRANE